MGASNLQPVSQKCRWHWTCDWCLKNRGRLVGLSPYSVGPNALSRWTVTDLNWIVGWQASVANPPPPHIRWLVSEVKLCYSRIFIVQKTYNRVVFLNNNITTAAMIMIKQWQTQNTPEQYLSFDTSSSVFFFKLRCLYLFMSRNQI